MSRYRGPKNRIARRYGVNLWGRAKDPLAKKKQPPGKAPGHRQRQKSSFRKHLEEKQKLRYYYGVISEKQFRSLFKKAQNKVGETMNNFLGLLESRLDVVVFRMNFAATIFAARQFVTHGHFLVNGKKVDIASYHVREGDVIELKEKSRTMPVINQHLESPERSLPGHVTLEAENFKGTFVKVPTKEEVPLPFELDENQIVEFYSN